MPRKPRLAVMKFASCDGCQLSLLDAEDELLTVCDLMEIAHFAEASSHLQPGPYDITLVEGSVITAEDAERIQRIRQDSRFLVTIGACATSGGVQALRNGQQLGDWVAAVYPKPEYIQTLATSTPIAAHVHVDFELRGCPINQRQLIDVILALLDGRQPRLPTHSVCLDCKLRGNVCHVVARGMACLGPLTWSGCGAICPTFDRGCYGCYGPCASANAKSLLSFTNPRGDRSEELVNLLQNFNAAAPAFHDAAEQLKDRAS